MAISDTALRNIKRRANHVAHTLMVKNIEAQQNKQAAKHKQMLTANNTLQTIADERLKHHRGIMPSQKSL